MQIGKARHLKICEDFGKTWMKIQEASEDITKGGILFPSPKTSYMEANTQKDEEKGIYA